MNSLGLCLNLPSPNPYRCFIIISCGILFAQRPLLLAKILGIYTVGFKNSRSGDSKRLDVVIMENILYGCRSQKVRSTSMMESVVIKGVIRDMLRDVIGDY